MKHISASFGIFHLVTQNNTFPVHLAMTTCTHKIRSKLNIWLKQRNCIFYINILTAPVCHRIDSILLCFRHFILFDVSEAIMLAICILLCSFLSKVCSCVSEALMLAIRILFYSCLSKLCSCVSKSLMLAIRILFCSCLSKVCCCISEALMLAIHILFCSCLSKVCSCVSEALMLALCVLSCSCLCNVSSTNSIALLRLASSLWLSAVNSAFLFNAKAWPHAQRDRFTCTFVPHCGHTFLKRIIWDIFLTVLAIQHQKNVERLNSLRCVPRRSSNKTRGCGRLAICARARARTLSISRAFIRRAPVQSIIWRNYTRLHEHAHLIHVHVHLH